MNKHTLNEHTWGRKTLWGSITLVKNTDYFKEKVKNSKVLNFFHI